MAINLLELSEQEIIRRGSLDEMRNRGIDPYPAALYPVNAYTTEIKETFSDDAPQKEVCVAGRIMSRRIMGKASFMELQDSRGRIQVYISRDDLCPDEDKDLYNVVFKKLLDIGDFVGVKGLVFRTQTGEISVHAKELTVLSKSLRPLPIVKVKDGVTYDAFDDPELRYRRRYVDLVVNDGVKEIFIKRTQRYSTPCVSSSTRPATWKWRPYPTVDSRRAAAVHSLPTIMLSTYPCIFVSPTSYISSASL